ncbi:MAG: hypothetical protein EAZ43_12225 [Betaproteobacteria bacterium]|nr:MAG: hypothetical protein EAZ43_12225 [Betaproteobacteria bacterium]
MSIRQFSSDLDHRDPYRTHQLAGHVRLPTALFAALALVHGHANAQLQAPSALQRVPTTVLKAPPIALESRADLVKLKGLPDNTEVLVKGQLMTVGSLKASFKSNVISGSATSRIVKHEGKRPGSLAAPAIVAATLPNTFAVGSAAADEAAQLATHKRELQQKLQSQNQAILSEAQATSSPKRQPGAAPPQPAANPAAPTLGKASVSIAGGATRVASGALLGFIRCNGHEYIGNPSKVYKDGADADDPRVTKHKGNYKPGGVLYLSGHCFGNQNGRVRLTGNFPGGFVDAKVQVWRDDLVVAEIPEGLTAPNHPATLQLRTTKAEYSNELSIAFDGVDPPRPRVKRFTVDAPPPPPAPTAPPPPIKWVDHQVASNRIEVLQCGNNQGSRSHGGDSCSGRNSLGSANGVKSAGFTSFWFGVADVPEYRGGREGTAAHTNWSPDGPTHEFGGTDVWETRFPSACYLSQQYVDTSSGQAAPDWQDDPGRSRLTVKWRASACWSYGNDLDRDYSCDSEYVVNRSVVTCPEGVNP